MIMNNIDNIRVTEGCPRAIVLKGSIEEMGRQYGNAFAEDMRELNVIVKAAVFGAPFTTAMYGFVPPTAEEAGQDMRALMFIAEKYCPEYTAWMTGLQKGCAEKGVYLEMEDLYMVTTYPDERWGRPGGRYPEGFGGASSENGSGAPRAYCNGFAVSGEAARDASVWVGVSGSPSDETVDRVMVIGYNEDGTYFSTFGTIANPFGQSGINGRGFAFAMTSNTSASDCDWGMSPELACFHIATQCASAEEAKRWLESVPRSFATGNFVFADAAGDICVCESNHAHFNIRKPGDAGEEGNYVVSTNHFAAKETLDFNVPEMEMWKQDSICRLATISQYVKQGIDQGGVDIYWIHHLLRQHDWYDPETNEWHRNEPASGKGSDVLEYTHSAFFNPAEMTAYYMQGTGGGIGVPAGTMGEFVQIPVQPDITATVEMMMMDAFFGGVHVARGELLRVTGNSKTLQQDYASRSALRELLDEAYRNYERGVNRWAFAYKAKSEENDEAAYLTLISEAIAYFGKTQMYAKKLMSELKYYDD